MCKPGQKAWHNHPCFKMWDGYDFALIEYGFVICSEWVDRGYKDTLKDKFLDILVSSFPYENTKYPKWLGNEEFHSRHRAALLAKNYEWYSQFGWKEEPKIDYIWGTNNV